MRDWLLIAGIGGIDALLSAILGIPIAGWREDAEATLFLFLLFVPVTFVVIRITGLAKDGLFMSELPAKIFATLKVTMPLIYFAAMSPMPLADDALQQMDMALGFDWLRYYHFVMSHPNVRDVLDFCYGHFTHEAAIVLVAVVLLAQNEARAFVRAMIVSLLITALVFAALPATGPFITGGLDALPPGADFTEHFLAAHAHKLTGIDEMRGIISFPSYHACTAVLLTYFSRPIRPLFLALLPANALMLMATPVFGGHYLVDVLAGLGVAAMTIATTSPRASARDDVTRLARAEGAIGREAA